MQKEDTISDGSKIIQRQQKVTDQDFDGKTEERGGGSEMEGMEDDAISSEVPKAIECPEENADRDAEGAVDGVDKQEEALRKVTAQMQNRSSGGGRKEGTPMENSEDDLILLQILPKEIWEKVTDLVDDGDDLHNLSKSSPFFKDLLEPKKTLHLFPSVWKVLGKKFFENYKKSGVYNELYNEKNGTQTSPTGSICGDCGRRRETQRFSGILKLRLVSKVWSKAVDKSIQNGVLQQSHDQVAYRNNPSMRTVEWMWTSDWYFGMNNNLNTAFHRHFDGTHAFVGEGDPSNRSPFLSRNIDIGDHVAPVMGMLQLYGHHVQQCAFRTLKGDLTPSGEYSLFRQLLELMPNVKGLEFFNLIRDDYRQKTNVKRDELLRAEMRLRPMPFLKDLQLLKFAAGQSKTFSSLLEINNHVTTLVICLSMDQEDYFDMYSIPLPRLRRLCIYYEYDRNFQKFVDWKFPLYLTHLDLSFGYYPELLSIAFDKISTKLGGTLTDLNLEFGSSQRNRMVPGYQKKFRDLRLQLPNLKAFIFKLDYYCSLEFLYPVKQTLEYLELNFFIVTGVIPKITDKEKEEVRSEEESINFMSCIFEKNGYLRDSNIWELFPKLKEIKFEDYSHPRTSIKINRHDWEMGGIGRVEIHEYDSNDEW